MMNGVDVHEMSGGREGRGGKSWGRRLLIRLAVYPLLILAVLLVMSCAMQRMMMYPRSAVPAWLAQLPPPDGAQVLQIDTDQGVVHGWFIPGDGVSDENPGPMVIFGHGNGETINGWAEALAVYRKWGVSVLLPEYRGYGEASGSPTQKRITADFKSFYALAVQRPDVDADRMGYHGFSLGGAVVAQLADAHPPRAMILQSTFTSVDALAWEIFKAPSFLIVDHWRTDRVVEQAAYPVLIIHGRLDRQIDPEHGRRLAEMARDGEMLLVDAGHDLLPDDFPEYWPAVKDLLHRAGVIDE